MSTAIHRHFPAEWAEQDAVLLAWPHRDSDWAQNLAEVEATYCDIIRHIACRQRVILTTPDTDTTQQALAAADIDPGRVQLFPIPSDDTWARDFGPISILENNSPLLLDFTFNGWGGKFSAQRDNRITTELHRQGAFGSAPLIPIDFVLEGGSIESDGRGTLLTTSQCLLEQNRNPGLNQRQLNTLLCEYFGVKQILWLDAGELIGDDTDGHIDTLARFAPNGTILYQGCHNPADPHFKPLRSMAQQLAQFYDLTGAPYQLMELPLPQPIHDLEGQRLPAGYANFLVINGAVLVPTYADPADQQALELIGAAFPEREIIGIDCRSLIKQHGSLHCVTMQIAKGLDRSGL